MNNNQSTFFWPPVQILFALADTNSDGVLQQQEVLQLFDRILIGAQIDPANNYQGLGIEMHDAYDPVITTDLGEFTNSIITWANTIVQMAYNAPDGKVFFLIDGNTITPHQAVDRIQWVMNNMDFAQAQVLPVAQEVVNPAHQNQNIPIAHIEPSLPPTIANCPSCQFPITGPAFNDITTNPLGNESLACGHVFHMDCLNAMRNATNNLRCPLCQTPFVGGRRTFRKSSQKTKKNKRKIPFSKKGKKRKTRQKRKQRQKRKTRRGRK